MRRPITAATAALLTFVSAACTTHPDNVVPHQVSTATYGSLDCAQLLTERDRLITEVHKLIEVQRQNAEGDALMMTVGLLVAWPVLIGMAATRDRKEDLARLKGEYDAVELAARERTCNLPPPPPPPARPELPAAPPAPGL